jgi:hypothetical protein
LTSEWSFWSGKDRAPVQHFTLQLDDSGNAQCTLEDTSSTWVAPISFDGFEFAGKEAPNAAFVPLDSYSYNYTTNDVQYVDTWYFLDEYPVYLNSRLVDDTDGVDYAISYKTPGIDDLKPFFDLPSVCKNATAVKSGAKTQSQRFRPLSSPVCHATRQTRCCVYMLETDKGQLVFHNNVKSAPSCPASSGRAALCNERCVSNMYDPDISYLIFHFRSNLTRGVCLGHSTPPAIALDALN